MERVYDGWGLVVVYCLINNKTILDFEKSCEAAYQNRFGFKPNFIHFELGSCAEIIKQKEVSSVPFLDVEILPYHGISFVVTP
jgi:hypothetical protein